MGLTDVAAAGCWVSCWVSWELVGGPGLSFMQLPIIQRLVQAHLPGSPRALQTARRGKSESAYSILCLYSISYSPLIKPRLKIGPVQVQRRERKTVTVPLERSLLRSTTISTHILLMPKPTLRATPGFVWPQI